MTKPKPDLETVPDEFDGTWLIAQIHRIGDYEGYERVRVDRGTRRDTGRYYEVGYGPMNVVTMSTQIGEVYQITAETWRSLSLTSIHAMLVRNKEVVAP